MIRGREQDESTAEERRRRRNGNREVVITPCIYMKKNKKTHKVHNKNWLMEHDAVWRVAWLTEPCWLFTSSGSKEKEWSVSQPALVRIQEFKQSIFHLNFTNNQPLPHYFLTLLHYTHWYTKTFFHFTFCSSIRLLYLSHSRAVFDIKTFSSISALNPQTTLKLPALSSSSLSSTQFPSYPTPLCPNRKSGAHLPSSAASENNWCLSRGSSCIRLSPPPSLCCSLPSFLRLLSQNSESKTGTKIADRDGIPPTSKDQFWASLF